MQSDLIKFCENDVDKNILAQLDINSIRNKLDQLFNVIVLITKIISESKSDNTFPDGQFLLINMLY